MTEVKWELSGGNDMKPDATNGGDKNLIPRVSAGTPAIGTPDDPWYGATLTSANYNFMYHCNYEYDRIIMGFEVIPNWATMYARINMIQLDDESELAVLSLRQMSPEAPLTILVGTEANDQDATISKVNGTGAVDGPKKKFGMDTYGWKFANKMEKVNLNGTIYYRPLYLPDE